MEPKQSTVSVMNRLRIDHTWITHSYLLILYRLRQKSWSPSSVSCVAARKIVRRSVLGPVRDITEDVKKPNKQTNKQTKLIL